MLSGVFKTLKLRVTVEPSDNTVTPYVIVRDAETQQIIACVGEYITAATEKDFAEQAAKSVRKPPPVTMLSADLQGDYVSVEFHRDEGMPSGVILAFNTETVGKRHYLELVACCRTTGETSLLKRLASVPVEELSREDHRVDGVVGYSLGVRGTHRVGGSADSKAGCKVTAQEICDMLMQADGWNKPGTPWVPTGTTGRDTYDALCSMLARSCWWRVKPDGTIDSQFGRLYEPTLDGAHKAMPQGWYWLRRYVNDVLVWSGCPDFTRPFTAEHIQNTPDTGDAVHDLWMIVLACRTVERAAKGAAT